MEICLDSLRACTRRSYEVIVVDNGSDDGSPEFVATHYPEVQLIRNRENIGFPRGNNLGIRAAKGNYIFVLNSDIKVLGNCVDALVDYLEANPDVGMIGPKILNADLTHQSSCRENPTLWNNFCSASGLATIFKQSRLFSGEHMLYFKGDRTIDVDVLVGCFWTVRRTALDQFGLLDEGFFIYAEDVDWCKRCWNAGWRVVFYHVPEAIHYRGVSTTKKDPVRFALTQQRSVLRYWKKHHGLGGKMSMSLLILMHLSVRAVATAAVYIARPSRRAATATKLRVTTACLGSLFAGQPSN
jgi:GT2 family glycosyltransferase